MFYQLEGGAATPLVDQRKVPRWIAVFLVIPYIVYIICLDIVSWFVVDDHVYAFGMNDVENVVFFVIAFIIIGLLVTCMIWGFKSDKYSRSSMNTIVKVFVRVIYAWYVGGTFYIAAKAIIVNAPGHVLVQYITSGIVIYEEIAEIDLALSVLAIMGLIISAVSWGKISEGLQRIEKSFYSAKRGITKYETTDTTTLSCADIDGKRVCKVGHDI
jgi:hypothetical protein